MNHIARYNRSSRKINKRRPSKLTEESINNLLMLIDQTSITNFKQMVKSFKSKHNIQVTTQAISNLLKDIVITSKQATNIPAS